MQVHNLGVLSLLQLVFGCASTAQQSHLSAGEVAAKGTQTLVCGQETPAELCALAKGLADDIPTPWSVELDGQVLTIVREARFVREPEMNSCGADDIDSFESRAQISVTMAEGRLTRDDWQAAHISWTANSREIQRLTNELQGAHCNIQWGDTLYRFCPKTRKDRVRVQKIRELENTQSSFPYTESMFSKAFMGDFFPVTLATVRNPTGCTRVFVSEEVSREAIKLEQLVLSRLEPYMEVVPSFARPDLRCQRPLSAAFDTLW